MYRRFILAVAFLISIPPIASALPSREDKFVNDFADVITESVRKDIAGKAAAVHRQYDGAQIAVVTVNSLDGLTIEKYANTLFNTWGLGDRKANNGVLFLIVPRGAAGSRLRIEVGIGLEKTITDETAGHILDQVLPHYERGDYSTTAAAGFDLIAERIAAGEDSGSGFQKSDIGAGMIAVDILISLFMFVTTLAVTFGIIDAFSGRPSPQKIDKMGIADGGYTMEDESIFMNAEKKTNLFWLSSVPIAAAAQSLLRACGVGVNDDAGGIIPLGWLMSAVCAVIAAVVCDKRKYACPKCSGILEHTSVVEEEPTYNEEGKMRIYLACRECGNKYTSTESIPVLSDESSGSYHRRHRHGHRSGSSFGGGRSGGGGGRSRGGGASR